jgi:hypothetical protein
MDSQNNAAGGYCWGEALTYYYGSILQVEWTAQHGCGTGHNNVDCNFVLQYMCGAELRDGVVDERIPLDENRDNKNANGEYLYGMHETYEFYMNCSARRRNNGLFAADRVSRGNLNPNGPATNTRQNNNGARSGYECPEERDYYPYWHPAPWKDIAVITSNIARCNYYKSESQNVKPRNLCSIPDWNNQVDCLTASGTWDEYPAWGIAAPDCVSAEWNRDNHLGNSRSGMTNIYRWVIPSLSTPDEGQNCVFRLRYNISSGDYNAWQHVESNDDMIDARYNDKNSPVKQNPVVIVGDFNYTLALNTNQYGRTFEDRSHIFRILPRPADLPLSGRIINLNVRGRRGNIVQCYPATEYDFTPNNLQVNQGDYIHFQWTGCDFNQGGAAGEGTDKTDRHNFVILKGNEGRRNYPASLDDQTFLSREVMERFAHVDQPTTWCDTTGTESQDCCLTQEQITSGQVDANQDKRNCNKLNAGSAYFNGGVIQMSNTGTWNYYSTRNNNFTNRSQKAQLTVNPLIPWWGVAFVAVGGAGFVGGAVVALLVYWAKAHPGSAAANYNLKI